MTKCSTREDVMKRFLRQDTVMEAAAHEAGHVIAFWHSEIPVLSVFVSDDCRGGVKIGITPFSIDMFWRYCVGIIAGSIAQRTHSGSTHGSIVDYKKLNDIAAVFITNYCENGYLPPMPWDRNSRITATVEDLIVCVQKRAADLLAEHAGEYQKVFEALDAGQLNHEQLEQILGPQHID